MRSRAFCLAAGSAVLLTVFASEGFSRAQGGQNRIPQQIVINGQMVNGAIVIAPGGQVQSFTCSSPQHYVTADGASQGWACYEEATGVWLLSALPPAQAQPAPAPVPVPQQPPVQQPQSQQPAVIYPQAPPSVVYPQAPPAVVYPQAPPTVVYQQPAPTVIYQQPPTVIYQQAPPTVVYQPSRLALYQGLLGLAIAAALRDADLLEFRNRLVRGTSRRVTFLPARGGTTRCTTTTSRTAPPSR